MRSKPQTEWLFREQWDPSARKHHGNPACVEAHERVAGGKREMYKQIVAFVIRQGEHGATVHELCDHLGKLFGRPIFPNTISGRLTELLDAKELVRAVDPIHFTIVKRNGAAVLLNTKPRIDTD